MLYSYTYYLGNFRNFIFYFIEEIIIKEVKALTTLAIISICKCLKLLEILFTNSYEEICLFI